MLPALCLMLSVTHYAQNYAAGPLVKQLPDSGDCTIRGHWCIVTKFIAM